MLERKEATPNWLGLIESDLASGGQQTFDGIVGGLRAIGGMGEDIFGLAKSDIVQVDVGVASGEQPYRIDLQRDPKSLTKSFSIWAVNAAGHPVGDSYGMMSYFSGEQKTPRAVLEGSFLGSIDGGDLPITPQQLAGRLEEVLGGLNDSNWRLVIGEENVPTGEI